jgi:hypothetical protein
MRQAIPALDQARPGHPTYLELADWSAPYAPTYDGSFWTRAEEQGQFVRKILALFKRQPTSDFQKDRISYEGYRVHWPDGEAVAIGFERFCQQGCRLLGLGRRIKTHEQLVEMLVYPVSGLEAPLTQVSKGTRCRRFYLERQEGVGRMFFFNGSPTDIVFDAERDDQRVLDWIGVTSMSDGERMWFDFGARTVV